MLRSMGGLPTMWKRSAPVSLILPFLLFVTLACGPCSLLAAETPAPPRPIAVSTEAAGQLQSRMRQNVSGEPGQQFILHMTDTEVTSLLAEELLKYDESPVADPKIWFTKGRIYGTGRLVNVLPVETEVAVVASARIDDGKVKVQVEEISAGALPLPNRLLETVSQSINETVEEMQLDVEITALEILEGEAILKGTRR
jgi:hypothetical protein